MPWNAGNAAAAAEVVCPGDLCWGYGGVLGYIVVLRTCCGVGKRYVVLNRVNIVSETLWAASGEIYT